MERLGGLGVHTLEELQTFTSRVSPGRTPQAAPRRAPAALPRRLPVPRRARAGALRRHLARPAHPGARPTSPPPRRRSRMGEMVNLAASVTGIECATPLEAGVRELRLIAAHKPRYNRRSRHPGEGALAQAHRRAVAAAVPGPQGGRGRCRLPRPVRLAPHGGEVPRRAARGVPDPAVQRPARRSRRRGRRASSPRWAAASPPATAASTMDHYAALVATVRDNLLERADEVVDALTARMDRLAERRALRGGRRPPRPAVGVPAGRFADPAPRRPCPRAPSWSLLGERTTTGGRCTSYDTAGWPPPA